MSILSNESRKRKYDLALEKALRNGTPENDFLRRLWKRMKQRPFTAWDASEIGKHSKRPLKPGVSSVLLTAGTYSRGKQHLFDRVEGKLYRFRAAAAQLL